MKLEENRKLIDEIDSQIVDLMNKRCRIAQRIGRIKSAAGLPVVDHDRERVVLSRVASDNSGPLDKWVLVRIYTELLAESRRIQMATPMETLPVGEAAR